MFSKITSAVTNGLRYGALFGLVASILAFLAAPTFFGIVFITASVVMTVMMYGVIGFVIGVAVRFFRSPTEIFKSDCAPNRNA